ncbi:AlkZ family DNA glycosylase [bacterium]|nr:AlkZ family DNA glycosylase [bacterium]
MPRTAAQSLSLQALNRATLARQLLLARAGASPHQAIASLAGMQGQVPKPPFIGLWTRLEGFKREDLASLVHRREVVRATMMRGTIHYMTAEDYRRLRPALSEMLSGAIATTLRGRAEGLDLEGVAGAARELFAEGPRTFTELRGQLMARFPEGDERVMGFAARMHLPLVMVPDDSAWAYPADAAFTLAETWLGAELAPVDTPHELVRRYLAAFGPATVADAQTWSGLKGLKPVFEALRDELVTFKDPKGRELFDLPDAPRPGEEVSAPMRFLPEYDNLVLAHADRTRLVDDAHRARLVTKNLKVLASFTVDGRIAGTWSIERKAKRATLALSPFEAIAPADRDALAAEGEALLRFAEPDAASHELSFLPV